MTFASEFKKFSDFEKKTQLSQRSSEFNKFVKF